MVPLLLLLLLPQSLADQVCLNISNGHMNITMTDARVEDGRISVNCIYNNSSCIFLCEYQKNMCLNGSSFCFDATVTNKTDPPRIQFDLTPYMMCNLYPCVNYSILPLMTELSGLRSDQKEMMKLFYVRDSCPQLFGYNSEVKKAYIRAECKIIDNIIETTQLEPGDSMIYDMKALTLNVVNISEANIREANISEANLTFKIDAPQLLPENMSFIPDIWLPVNALRAIPEGERVIGLVSYMHGSQFQVKQEEISSMVLRIELQGKHRLQDLKTPITMTFGISPNARLDNDTYLQCHYFDENDFLWKTDGCETNNSQTYIICNCNHATPFAVLLMRDPITKIHWEILSIISYIGCGLSAFFTALSLVIYVFGRNHRMDYSISIHVSLSGALFLLNTTFLLTEWGAKIELDWVCVFVAALMHYSLLCCFTWMAIEALHLYLLLIKVFNTYFKHYMVKLSLAGWGIPGIIVAVSLGMRDLKQLYGLTEMTMADTNQTNAICWITDDSYFYSLNLVYFTLIFIFNSGILLTVASNICKMKQVSQVSSKLGQGTKGKMVRDSQRVRETCRRCLTVMGLTCLMGTTWGLAFLGSGYVNLPILYLFCILNSTQGFFIFLWICLSAKKQRKRDMEDRLTSTPAKSSAVKFD
ncbi:adhesion G-protein coupled receptor G2-like [Gymnodraco acuticeps]|uniref:Adhesion G-protein coupled receptor G2-like n=1 Tax=Gymnodraco acuticeps TaxID=8218 RepID=A0A6P8VCD0_GYMAC|nr:adhesion G-protein coupled receptor G2-like [Gymnodraco acuticeps]